MLTATTPVTLTYDNGQGLVFRRTSPRKQDFRVLSELVKECFAPRRDKRKGG